MNMKPNVLPVPEAARQKCCTRQTIYNALTREDLTEATFEDVNTRLVLLDSKWTSWQPAQRGRRASEPTDKDGDIR